MTLMNLGNTASEQQEPQIDRFAGSGRAGQEKSLSVFFGYIKDCEREIRALKHHEAHLNERTNTVANIRVVGITLIIVLAINQLAMIVLARILGPGDFGTYAIC